MEQLEQLEQLEQMEQMESEQLEEDEFYLAPRHGSSPQTGDESQIMINILVMIVCGCCLKKIMKKRDNI